MMYKIVLFFLPLSILPIDFTLKNGDILTATILSENKKEYSLALQMAHINPKHVNKILAGNTVTQGKFSRLLFKNNSEIIARIEKKQQHYIIYQHDIFPDGYQIPETEIKQIENITIDKILLTYNLMLIGQVIEDSPEMFRVKAEAGNVVLLPKHLIQTQSAKAAIQNSAQNSDIDRKIKSQPEYPLQLNLAAVFVFPTGDFAQKLQNSPAMNLSFYSPLTFQWLNFFIPAINFEFSLFYFYGQDLDITSARFQAGPQWSIGLFRGNIVASIFAGYALENVLTAKFDEISSTWCTGVKLGYEQKISRWILFVHLRFDMSADQKLALFSTGLAGGLGFLF